jgi:ABC-2 type transport system ATP-binding protein
MQSIITQLSKNGVTVLLTSHNLSLIEKLCTEIAIMNKGGIIFQDSSQHISKYIKKVTEKDSILESVFMEFVLPEQKTAKLSWLQ